MSTSTAAKAKSLPARIGVTESTVVDTGAVPRMYDAGDPELEAEPSVTHRWLVRYNEHSQPSDNAEYRCWNASPPSVRVR